MGSPSSSAPFRPRIRSFIHSLIQQTSCFILQGSGDTMSPNSEPLGAQKCMRAFPIQRLFSVRVWLFTWESRRLLGPFCARVNTRASALMFCSRNRNTPRATPMLPMDLDAQAFPRGLPTSCCPQEILGKPHVIALILCNTFF